ncbi:MAG TPA: phosphatase PAP2 family protein [Leucothrix sp.]|nr:phosphatase PAP2 family protein [Leucothrix sp.]
MINNLKPLVLILTLLLTTTVSASNNSDDDSSNKEKLGDALYLLLPASAYASTFYFDDKKGRSQFYKSILTNTAITLGLKNTVKKARPNGKDNKAFPSGHTSTSFQSAVFLHKRYGLKFAIPHYLGASYVAYSRIDSNNHDNNDVFAGALIGGLSSYFFTTHYKGISINPSVSNDKVGITVGMSW